MIYLDTNVFLDASLKQTEHAAAAKELLLRVAAGKIAAATSVLSWDEVVWCIWRSYGEGAARLEGERFISLPVTFLPAIPAVILKAQELLRTTALEPRDAIHAATALTAGISEFVTNDTDFDGVPGISRSLPEKILRQQ